eukprot:g60137.t1
MSIRRASLTIAVAGIAISSGYSFQPCVQTVSASNDSQGALPGHILAPRKQRRVLPHWAVARTIPEKRAGFVAAQQGGPALFANADVPPRHALPPHVVRVASINVHFLRDNTLQHSLDGLCEVLLALESEELLLLIILLTHSQDGLVRCYLIILLTDQMLSYHLTDSQDGLCEVLLASEADVLLLLIILLTHSQDSLCEVLLALEADCALIILLTDQIGRCPLIIWLTDSGRLVTACVKCCCRGRCSLIILLTDLQDGLCQDGLCEVLLALESDVLLSSYCTDSGRLDGLCEVLLALESDVILSFRCALMILLTDSQDSLCEVLLGSEADCALITFILLTHSQDSLCEVLLALEADCFLLSYRLTRCALMILLTDSGRLDGLCEVLLALEADVLLLQECPLPQASEGKAFQAQLQHMGYASGVYSPPLFTAPTGAQCGNAVFWRGALSLSWTALVPLETAEYVVRYAEDRCAVCVGLPLRPVRPVPTDSESGVGTPCQLAACSVHLDAFTDDGATGARG